MAQVAVIDERDIAITPVFMHREIEDIPKSEVAGYAVMKVVEGVEVRFAGQKTYSPFFPADAFSHRDGNHTFTYAERWPEQYRLFKEGNPQEAQGTPLQMLTPYGVTPEQMSLCRALKIYSIEALHQLENTKVLGMNANTLKAAATAFMAEKAKTSASFNELETLRARIAELESRSTIVPPIEPTVAEIEQATLHADLSFFDNMGDAELKDAIAALPGGTRPKGNPSRNTLIQMYQELQEA